MTDEPKIQAAIDAALSTEPEAPAPNPKREVPMPDTFTRIEDFLNTPLFETKTKGGAKERWRPSPGALFNLVSCLAGIASISAALYWYSSAKKYQKLSADLAGKLQIAYQHHDGNPGSASLTREQGGGLTEEATPVSFRTGPAISPEAEKPPVNRRSE